MRKAGKNRKSGLNAKGRASYKGGTLKAPVKSGDNPRRASFLARMGNGVALNTRMVSQLDFF